MKVLVTSGGTKIKIDAVRSITNMSRGTFGAKICDAFWTELSHGGMLNEDYESEIVFFCARESRRHVVSTFDSGFLKASHCNIRIVEFGTFDEYRNGLFGLVTKERFDILCMAAAVSDYGVEDMFDGKYRSRDEEMGIRLTKLPKIITEVRKLCPNSVLCGFKLLVNSTDEELRDAMARQFSESGIDICIGNDLRDIRNDNHRLTIGVKGNPSYKVYTKNYYVLPNVVEQECVSYLIKRMAEKAVG